MSYVSDLPPHSILYRPPMAIDIDEGGWRASMTFRCSYADKTAFLVAAAGTVETIPTPSGTIERVVPLRHPEYPDLLAVAFRVEGGGTPSSDSLYSDARISVEFGVPPYPINGDRPFMEIHLRQGGTQATVPGEGMRFPSDNSPLRRDYGVYVPAIGYEVTTFMNPSLNDALIGGVIGKVNSTPFLGWDPGTVRFDGCDSSIAISSTFARTFTRRYAMAFRRQPWDQVLRPGFIWEAPVGSSTGSRSHETADLNLLL